jgi:hypothetical protein
MLRMLVKFSDQLFGKRRYSADHWDDVITKYRETEIIGSHLSIPIPEEVCLVSLSLSPPRQVNKILSKIGDVVCQSHGKQLRLKPPHILDLHRDGYIGPPLPSAACPLSHSSILSPLVAAPHIDSIKFSGGIVAGVSLLSSRIFRLTLAEEFKHLHPEPDTPHTIEFIAHPRRLYILSQGLRYHYNHAVLAQNQTALLDAASFPIERRMSLIFRDEFEERDGT